MSETLTQLLSRECPIERVGYLVVPFLEPHGAVEEISKRSIGVWHQDLSLQDREVDLDLVKLTGMDGQMHNGDIRVSSLQSRPRAVSADQVKVLADLVRTPPTVLNLPWTQWSLSKVHIYATEAGIIPKISLETFRSTLIRGEITHQRTKTWKVSNDPNFQEKVARVKALYKHCPENRVVVCVDEFGPSELRPYGVGVGQHRNALTACRLRFIDPTECGISSRGADYLGGWFYWRKRGEEILDFLQHLPLCYPSWLRIYVILDNFSPHLRQDVREWSAANNTELVFIATNASWMKRIECHFAPLWKFALEDSFPETHRELQQAIRRYLRWRNADPKDPQNPQNPETGQGSIDLGGEPYRLGDVSARKDRALRSRDCAP